jgi:hypothetical protein
MADEREIKAFGPVLEASHDLDSEALLRSMLIVHEEGHLLIFAS